ncbi:hypothetical protein OZX62_08630 [Bifidobacterium sp. ESL0690]|uniref:hypothetical protein n=1 Tax=Bifidobacterium sp. ESL0690 TaxID=2983214 RepID=UPI0023F68FA1|nr:hypothetical protein [Bifidobacterium sp. ESL0690]WEV46487.1 hypothetical protein OZX62_08630 [Bifidobacterium sp. ESL0690]
MGERYGYQATGAGYLPTSQPAGQGGYGPGNGYVHAENRPGNGTIHGGWKPRSLKGALELVAAVCVIVALCLFVFGHYFPVLLLGKICLNVSIIAFNLCGVAVVLVVVALIVAGVMPRENAKPFSRLPRWGRVTAWTLVWAMGAVWLLGSLFAVRVPRYQILDSADGPGCRVVVAYTGFADEDVMDGNTYAYRAYVGKPGSVLLHDTHIRWAGFKARDTFQVVWRDGEGHIKSPDDSILTENSTMDFNKDYRPPAITCEGT